MHVGLQEPEWLHGSHQVRVAAEVEILPGEHLVNVGVTAGAEEVVAAGAIGVDPVSDAVADDGGHRAQVRQTGPEPVEHVHMGPV